MNERDRKVIDQFRQMLEAGLSGFQLILFGSRARGDAAPDSDMDLIVLLEKMRPESEEYVRECAWQTSVASGAVLVPVVYSRAEWETGPERHSLLAIAVREEGIPI